MPPAALALVLAAALLHAVWNIVAKRSGGDSRFALIGSLQLVVLWAPVGLWFGWDAVPQWSWREWGCVLASAVVHLAYFNTLLRGYRVSDLTVVYPVARGTGPLLSASGAVLLFGEHLGVVGTAGVAGIALGVFLIAGYTLVDGYAVKVLLVSPILVDYVGNVLRLPFLLPIAWRDPAGLREAWHTQWKHALAVAVLGPVAYVMVLYAVTMAPLSHVAPAREVSMLFAALIGGRLLGETDRGLRLAGAACIALGVVALVRG
jgi:drug/metabolite transporter (DMT)-like permease